MDELTQDRLALRLGAFRLARRRGNVTDVAWAAERLRLPGIVLDRIDARYARNAIVRFGHAMRVARVRKDREVWPPTGAFRTPAPAGARWRRWAAALAAVVVVLLLLLLPRGTGLPGEQAGGGAAVQVAGKPAPASPLLGRSRQAISVVAPVVSVTQAPQRSAAPTANPDDAEDRLAARGVGSGGGSGGGGGGGGGGSGGGTGTGTGGVIPLPTPSPTPDRFMRLRGKVIDQATTEPVPGVCVSIAARSCSLSPISDAQGNWQIDLELGPSPVVWEIKFIKNNYLDQEIRVPSQPGLVYRTDQLRRLF